MKPKHPLIVALTVIISLLIGGVSLLQLLRTEVVLVDGDEEAKIVTFSRNIKGVLKEQSLALRPLDEVYPPEETQLSEGLRIVVKRFRPIVVRVGEREIEVYEKHLTAKEVLRRAGVMLGGQDQLSVSLDRVIKSGEVISVNREEKSLVTVDKELPFENKTVVNQDLDPGERRIEQFGSMGVSRESYEVTRLGTQELGRVLVKTEVVSEPIAQIMQIGPATKKPKITIQTASVQTQAQTVSARSSSNQVASNTNSSAAMATSNQLMTSRSKDFAYKNSYVMIATAYDLSYASTGKLPGQPDYGITASGTKARVGAVAVDPKVIPLGTKLYIEYADGTGGYGYATAEDTGSAIKGYRVDLFFNTYQECIEFGRRRVIVYVLE